MLRISYEYSNGCTYARLSRILGRSAGIGSITNVIVSRLLFKVRIPRRLQLWLSYRWIAANACSRLYPVTEDPLVLAIQAGIPRGMLFIL